MTFFKYITITVKDWRVLDPACGNGNLLIVAARRLRSAGFTAKDIASRLCGVDIDPQMVEECKDRLATELELNPSDLNIHIADYLETQ